MRTTHLIEVKPGRREPGTSPIDPNISRERAQVLDTALDRMCARAEVEIENESAACLDVDTPAANGWDRWAERHAGINDDHDAELGDEGGAA